MCTTCVYKRKNVYILSIIYGSYPPVGILERGITFVSDIEMCEKRRCT